jgi:predicted NBD/HSP70 family sugar kinase
MGLDAAISGRPAPQLRDLARGTNQIGVRLYNERLVLSLIRRLGRASKAEIARLTGLSAQTISVIVKQLEADALLLKETPVRGRVGQPSVPFRLNPRGALSLGLKIGRRSADLVLMDFVGRVLGARRETYPFPEPGPLFGFVERSAPALTRPLAAAEAARIAGLGIALPFELWSWHEEVGAPGPALGAWRGIDVQAEVAGRCPWSVLVCNDATAACGAELVFGQGDRFRDYLYLFIGSFVGGGLVLDRHLFPGRTGNAAALGSTLVPGGPQGVQQLIDCASLFVLERRCLAAGLDPTSLWRSPDEWSEPPDLIDAWIDEAAGALAVAIVSAVAVVDVEAVVIDGAFPAWVRARFVERIATALAEVDQRGLGEFELVEGTIGSRARAIGGATLPLLANFAQDREVLFTEAE